MIKIVFKVANTSQRSDIYLQIDREDKITRIVHCHSASQATKFDPDEKSIEETLVELQEILKEFSAQGYSGEVSLYSSMKEERFVQEIIENGITLEPHFEFDTE